ncbi:hypothetical protein KKC59_03965 [bacterium]|nr:hypothetical protein [bacterium]
MPESEDRDGVVELRWDTLNIGGRPAEKYEIIILGFPVATLNNHLLSFDPYLVLNPVYHTPAPGDKNKSSQSFKVNLLELIGPNFEGVKALYRNKINNMVLNNRNTDLYFAVRASNTQDAIVPWALDEKGGILYVPVLGPDGRQRKNSDGTWMVERVANYSFVGCDFSKILKVDVRLNGKPEKLKVVPVEKKCLENSKPIFVDKPEITGPVMVQVGFAEHEEDTWKDLNNYDGKDYRVYEDKDGILELRWEIESGSRRGQIPNYPLYDIQVSKWPVFYYANDFLGDVQSRYFAREEGAHFVYYPENFMNVREDVPNGFSSLYEGSNLTAPFFTKNLAVKSFANDSNGNPDFGKPLYYDDDPYGAIDIVNGNQHSIYYLRIRAMGNEGGAFREHDNRAGDWSELICIRLNKNQKLPKIIFRNTPQEVDEKRSDDTKLLPQGNVPLIWDLDKKDPKDPSVDENQKKYPVYQLLASVNPNLVSDDGKRVDYEYINSIQKSVSVGSWWSQFIKKEKPYFAEDYILSKKLGIGTFADPHHIKNLLDKEKNKVSAGKYYFWLRTVSDEADSVPSLWSKPVNADISEYLGTPMPNLTSPDKNKDYATAVIPVNWYFNKAGDALSDKYKKQDSKDYVPYYQLLVYREPSLKDSESKMESPVDADGYLKYDDQGDNDVNNWEETIATGGKAYGVYRILDKEIITDKADKLYDLNLFAVYNLAKDKNGGYIYDENGNYVYEQSVQDLPSGIYHFYLRAYNKNNIPGKLSPAAIANVPDKIELPKQPIIVDPKGLSSNGRENPWLVPVNWRFDGVNDILSLGYDAYQVLIYEDDVVPVDENNNLLYEDADKNDKNDYEETSGAGKAYGVFFAGKQYLGKGSLEDPYFMADLTVGEYVESETSTEENPDYIPVYRDIVKKGNFKVYVRALTSSGIPSKCSDQGSYSLIKDVYVPEPLVLTKPSSNTTVKVALIGVGWTPVEKDVVYELQTARDSGFKDLLPTDYLKISEQDLQKEILFYKNLSIISYDENNNPVYLNNDENGAENGDYYFRIRTAGLGNWSNTAKVTLQKEIVPDAVYLASPSEVSPRQPDIDKNGIVGLRWWLTQKAGVNIPTWYADELGRYPVYEIQICKGSNSFDEANTHTDYTLSSSLINAATGKQFDGCPFVRDISSDVYPLKNTNGENIFENNKMYYFRVRALSNEGFPSLKGAWSNDVGVKIEKGKILPAPVISTNPAGLGGVLETDFVNFPYDKDIVSRYYDVKFGYSASDLAKYTIAQYEICEGEDQSPDNWSQVRMAFFPQGDYIRRSVEGKKYFTEDKPVVSGKKYYYKVRARDKVGAEVSADGVDDAMVSDWSDVAVVYAPVSSSVDLMLAGDWREE